MVATSPEDGVFAIGTRVGNYVIEESLGGGGMARVFRVRHAVLGSTHALKVLLPELVEREDVRLRFLDEGRIQATFRHPRIVPVTDIVAEPGIAGLIMEYVHGETLEDVIERAPAPPSAGLVREIFLQVLDGIGFVHAHGVVHRDIKPANILVTRDADDRLSVRILDFGIAKWNERRGATRTGVAMGTPNYMSPEQIRGAREVTAASDIFALGATLYELASGRPAFEGDSDFDIQKHIVEGRTRDLAEVHPGVDPRIAAAVRKALQPDPAQRFRSCEEFARALSAEVPAAVAPAPPKPAEQPAPAPPSAPGEMGFFVEKGLARGKVHRSSKPVQVIGSDPGCDLVLADRSVGKQHAQLAWDGAKWVLKDLGTSSGVLVNADRITSRPLADGDLVGIGALLLRFEANPAPVAAPPPAKKQEKPRKSSSWGWLLTPVVFVALKLALHDGGKSIQKWLAPTPAPVTTTTTAVTPSTSLDCVRALSTFRAEVRLGRIADAQSTFQRTKQLQPPCPSKTFEDMATALSESTGSP